MRAREAEPCRRFDSAARRRVELGDECTKIDRHGTQGLGTGEKVLGVGCREFRYCSSYIVKTVSSASLPNGLLASHVHQLSGRGVSSAIRSIGTSSSASTS